MGEARRKKLAGNTEPSNPKWRRHKKFTRKDERELTQEVVEELTSRYLGMGLGLRRRY